MANLNTVLGIQATMRDNMLSPVTFATVADLRTKSVSFLLGGEVVTITASNPKTYIWIAEATNTDDGVNIIKPTDLASTSPGRWRLVAHQIMKATATYDPPNLVDAAGATTTVALVGAVLGDFAIASFSLSLQGILMTAFVSAADVVTVVLQNETGGAIDLASGTLAVLILKQ
jgi:hypothetical protein